MDELTLQTSENISKKRTRHKRNRKKSKLSSPYNRHTVVSTDELVEKIKANLEDYSLRMQTYSKGTDCVACGIKGAFFALESFKRGQPNSHYNLYALDEDGKEVMMTSDHIKPRSKGGGNSLNNRQPMCLPCNSNKSNKYEA